MAIYSSRERLDNMHELFTELGNKRLDRGEVDALAAFYGGLSSSSQNKVRDRMIEIYRESSYSSGQQGRFQELLGQRGLSPEALEGVSADTVKGFLALSKLAQSTKIRELASDFGDGFTKEVEGADIAKTTRGKIGAELKKIEAKITSDHEDAEIGEPWIRAVYLSEGPSGKGKDLVGYVYQLPIYADEHDVSEDHYFNVKGSYLGSEYAGE
jgi:hypothetical protein